MTEAVVVGFGLVAGGDVRLLALVAAAVWYPLPAAMATATVVVIGRRAERRVQAGREIMFIETVVGELRSGASLRWALRSACVGLADCTAMIRLLDVGRPLDACLSVLPGRLPSVGGLVVAAVSAGAGGGRMLPVFEELMAHAVAEEQAAAELKTATAQVSASMMVLVGAPAAYLLWSWSTGRLARLLSLPGGAVVAATGAVMFMAGTAAMAVMSRRVR